ncbi:MAG: CoA pyrophosphatase [Gammaproteobacteria bacterium]|nr:CoA pyrophosphatase [Gammaproteobacteria bacterium]
MHVDTLSELQICERLRSSSPAGIGLDEVPRKTYAVPQSAAVLLPLLIEQGQWHLLYIRRADNHRDRHSGEVAFPGGRVEPGDSDIPSAALREAREEIGLDPGQVRLLGNLPAFHTISGYLVTPVVGAIPWPVDLAPDPKEVAGIFSIPLGWLADPVNHRERIWPSEHHPEARPVVFFRELAGELLWGISARITLDFLRQVRVTEG